MQSALVGQNRMKSVPSVMNLSNTAKSDCAKSSKHSEKPQAYRNIRLFHHAKVKILQPLVGIAKNSCRHAHPTNVNDLRLLGGWARCSHCLTIHEMSRQMPADHDWHVHCAKCRLHHTERWAEVRPASLHSDCARKDAFTSQSREQGAFHR